jgi:hypothetical protein
LATGAAEMSAITRQSSSRKPKKKTNESLAWAKFKLIRVVTYLLMALLWLIVLGVFYLIITGKLNATDVVKGLLVGGAIECVGKLFGSVYRAFLKPNG